MKVRDLNAGLVSGKMGNLIYYVMDGKQYVRRAALPGKKRKSEKEGFHPVHQEQMNRFSIVQAFYSFFRERVCESIWKTAARSAHCRANNLFHRLNSPCFNGAGELVDFTTFRFSYGELLLPRNVNITQEGDVYRVTWEDERSGTLTAADDKLCVGVIYESLALGPKWVKEVCGQRGDMQGTFRLDNPAEGAKHIYCFFGREDETAYSESLHFKLE
ncbi:hypothetical protein [Odoribacter lunatus]|uniref:hypothetical protein n=1 Tax=Odoribacter lunatus TaxID=2941335 RepID=UPI00203CE7DE|nr:hypothetical protein [Odoribacter lunatus]